MILNFVLGQLGLKRTPSPPPLTEDRLEIFLQVIQSLGYINSSDKRYQDFITPKQALDQYVQGEANRTIANEKRDNPVMKIIDSSNESDIIDCIFKSKI